MNAVSGCAATSVAVPGARPPSREGGSEIGRTGATADGPLVPFRALLLQDSEVPEGRGAAPSTLPIGLHRMAESVLRSGMAARPSPSQGQGGAVSAALTETREGGDEDDVVRDRSSHRIHDPAAASTVATHSDLDLTLAPVTLHAAAPGSPTASAVHGPASLEDLIPALVRRIAWSGDGHRGSMRLELGAGELAGGTLLVHAEAGAVSVHLDVPPGADASAWQRRLEARLASKGIPADTVEVA